MSNKLVESIKALVKLEVKKSIGPAIEQALSSFLHEEIENRVNAILAEKFVRNANLIEEKGQKEVAKARPQPKPVQKPAVSKKFAYLKESGMDSNPMAKLIFSDISDEEIEAVQEADGGDDDGYAASFDDF